MSYHTGGMNMRTTMGRSMGGRTTTSRARRTTTPNRGRMMNGTGARGNMRTAGQFGRGGLVRRTALRSTPIVRGGRTRSFQSNIRGRGVLNAGLGNKGFRGVDGRGNNI